MDHFDTTRRLYKNIVKPLIRYSRRRRIDILLDYVSGKSVLDLGCVEHESKIEKKRDWWLHGLIKKRARSLRGVDCDGEAVKDLQQQGYNICVADVENMDLREKGYDVIMAGELFEHLTNHRSFLECVKRHLAPNGVFVASMPNANSLNYFMQTLVFGHEVDAWDHAAFFTPVTITVMLNKCGFTPTEIVLYQPDEIYHHANRLHKLLAFIFNRLQQVVCWLRPSLARGLIVVAKSSVAVVGTKNNT